MDEKQVTKNQHFVPRTYLYKFGSKGLLDRCYIKPYKYEKNKSIKKYLCCDEWFYEFLSYIEDKETFIQITNFIEDELQTFETQYGIFYKQIMKQIDEAIIQKKSVDIKSENVEFLKKFIALQSIRTSKAFDIMDNIIKSFGINLNHLNEIEKKTLIFVSLFPKCIHKHPMTKYSLYDEFLKQLNHKNSIVSFLIPLNKGDRFFISDHPVVIIKDSDWYGFLLPINENVAIFIHNVNEICGIKQNMIIYQDSQQMRNLNELIVQNTNQYVMSLNFTNEELDFIKNIKMPE